MDKFSITAQNSVYLLIDFQSNLASAMKKEVIDNAERNVGLMISGCHALKVPILVTEQYKKGLGVTVDRIKDKLAEDYKPVDKTDFSCYANPEFLDKFRKVNRKYVMVSGIEAHVCVLQSVLDLLANGYFVHIITDSVCSRYKNDWKYAMDYLRDAGAVITTTEIAVFQLLKKAGTPEFKAMSPLFKNKESYWSL
jgi:nicotinamidase-related amidase